MKTFRQMACALAAFGLAGVAVAQSADPISNTAAVYGTYQTDVTTVNSKPLGSPADIDSALETLGGHNPDQLSKGWVSYMALIAAQDPAYRKSLREIESYYGRDVLVSGLKNDVRYARSLKGGDSAVGSALTASAADARRLNTAGAAIKEQAYSLQAAGWAKAKIGNSSAKATNLNSKQTGSGVIAKSGLISAFSASDIDATLAQAGASSSASLWDNVTSAASAVKFPPAVSAAFADKKRVKYGKEPVADRIATVAAYRVIGANGTPASEVQQAMGEHETKQCLNTANLNLQQCVAAASQQFELAFCIGTHAVDDVAKCTSVYQ